MKLWRSVVSGVGCFALLVLSPQMYAGVTDKITAMNTDTRTWQIRVVDESNLPIPSATVWRIIPDGRPGFDISLMQRLVRRYGTDPDFVQSGSVHPSLLVGYSNHDGLYGTSVKATDKAGLRTNAIYAVLKRGYYPSVVEGVLSTDGARKIDVKLHPNRSSATNKLMLQFDDLRAEACAPTASIKEEAGEVHRNDLLDLNRKIDELAVELERQGDQNLASAVYFNLAYLPSVSPIQDANRNEVVVGYTNGYSESDPSRKGNYEKAASLNSSNPNIAIISFRQQHGVPLGVSTLSPEQRSLYSDFLEKQISKFSEQIWPITYAYLPNLYRSENKFDLACTALTRAISFEPTYINWQTELKTLNSAAAKAQAPLCQL